MNPSFFIETAQNIIDGNSLNLEIYQKITDTQDKQIFDLLFGANLIRNHYFGNNVHLCNICNAKSGKCTEDCTFCSQSRFVQTNAPIYPLLSKKEIQKGAHYTDKTPINRYSVVTSGRGLPKKEISEIANTFKELNLKNVKYCASLGIIDSNDFKKLKIAGITRYHHNLETSKSHFSQICTTHTYEERIETIKNAKKAGLSVCSGGIFGIGETDKQILELALDLKSLDIDSVPINFLVPISGTPLEKSCNLTPVRCLKIIAIFRYVLPDKHILVCGGRMANCKTLYNMIFLAGASGIMTGNYLTTKGRTLEHDLEMIKHLGFKVLP